MSSRTLPARRLALLGATAALALLLGACQPQDGAGAKTAASGTPRTQDGAINFDRAGDEKGYWDMPSATGLVESGVTVKMDERGKLADIADAAKVAPFQPWAQALYEYRQKNDFADDPMKSCIGPGNPRMMHTPGGVRLIHDRNYNRMYLVFGGGNHGWRTIFLDGREPPNPDEVTGTFYGLSVGKLETDALVAKSIGFNTRFWFSNGGLPHTEALTLTERFTRPSHDELRYEVEIDDPRTYTRPWKAAWTLHWVAGDIAEHYCEDARP